MIKSSSISVMLFFTLISYSAQFASVLASDPPTIDSKILMQTSVSWDGEPIIYPAGEAEVTAVYIEIQPGENTGWHYHPIPSFAYLIEGNLEVTLKDGQSKTMEQGDTLAEVTNTVHNGRNIGESTVRLIVFYIGSKEDTLTIMLDNNEDF